MAQIFIATILLCFAFGYVHSQAVKKGEQKQEKFDSCADVDVDYKGGDIKLEQNIPSWRACARRCKRSKDCEVFTYVFKTKCCYHKSASALNNKQSGIGKISAKQNCGLYATKIMNTCEGDDITFECPAGKAIKIAAANYGRLTRDICPNANAKSITCEDPSSFVKVKQRCELKQSCTMLASNLIFGDPCKGTSKYLTVSFYCIPRPLDITLSPGVSMKRTDGGGCFFPKQSLLQKSTKLGTIASLHKTYEVSFEMWPITIKKGWTNVIHLSRGENNRRYGDRIPAVFFWQTGNEDTPADMFIAAAVNNNKNTFKKAYSKAPLKTWYKVKVQQQKVDGKYVYSLFINGKQVYKIVNKRPTVFKNVAVYASDPWFSATQVWIRNLCLSTKPF